MDEPQDPITELQEGAHQAHELYLSYVNAGFDEQQALYLTGKVITAAIRRD